MPRLSSALTKMTESLTFFSPDDDADDDRCCKIFTFGTNFFSTANVTNFENYFRFHGRLRQWFYSVC